LLGLLIIWLFHISVYGDTESPVDNAAIESVPGAIVKVLSAFSTSAFSRSHSCRI
jgi:hypothetical protein